LGLVDMIGTSFADDYLATGYGAYIAMPLLRAGFKSTLTRDEARTLLEKCMRVLFYRDARSWDAYSLAVVTKEGVELSETERLEGQSWAFADRIKGYGTQTV